MSSAIADNLRAAPHHLLSNGSYTVMLHASGAGFSRWRGQAVTRWREDPTTEPWGTWLLLRDEESAKVWAVTRQPLAISTPDDALAVTPGKLCFVRRHYSVHTTLEIAVASDADVELRRLTVSNHGDHVRTLSLTSYCELVLGPAGADNAHPAFSKLFVQTQWDPAQAMLLATRRQRDNHEPAIWAAQALQVLGRPIDDGCSYETDRARWLGRDRSVRDAQAMAPHAALSGTVGCVLDPVFSLRQHFTLAPRESVTLLLWTRLADSRDGALQLVEQLRDGDAAQRLFADAGQHAQTQLDALDIDAARAAQFAHWLSALVSVDPAQRAGADVIARGVGGAPTLWAKGISGDRPIALVQLDADAALDVVRDVLLAQRYWQSCQLAADVVLLNAASDTAAADALDAALAPLLETQRSALTADATRPKAEVFALRVDTLDAAVHDGLLTVARIVIDRRATATPHEPGFTAQAPSSPAAAPIRATQPAEPEPEITPTAAEFPNGHGGFVDAGRSYRIELADGAHTPAPWINVIANAGFGFLVSATGSGYTWAVNSQQNPLTPWPNDPVTDAPHEVLYLRDRDNGELWSATAAPIRVPGSVYSAVHGKGWTRFSHVAHGIGVELTQTVAVDAPLKLSRLRLTNRGSRTRHLDVTAYVQWALGANGTTSAPFVITARDAGSGALFARNPWRPDFSGRVAFMDLAGMQHSMTGDRAGFLGALGDPAHPAALHDAKPLDGRLGAGLDPCGALQATIELPAKTQLDVLFVLGDAPDAAQAQALVAQARALDFAQVLDAVRSQWDGVLDTVQVNTPDRALDLMLNDWLLYQVTSCRLWARTAGYQASGAYGFRDQLQDVMALCVTRPDLAREHLLRAAGRQFAPGDVQHWWLPPRGQGIRTRISDDRLWLGYVAAHYVDVTGDVGVLDEPLPFLTGPAIADGATDAFFQPQTDTTAVSLWEHCALALDTALTAGAHGLPLIGTGDWNDGMNLVGAGGKGESSWLAWFALATIAGLAPHADARGEAARAQRWQTAAGNLRTALEHAWDGQWYRRGYYDDGTPLGSCISRECWIDTIAQSWSLLSGEPVDDRARQAMAAVDRLLVDHPHRVARLFTPPFDHPEQNPGYIKGYPPGVRENGGQYTHGATWSVFAWARLGDGERTADTLAMLNPIHHSDSASAVARYKVEPYVACADVYSVAPHIGRGGWTWYTGSAAWVYRAGLEALLGFHLHGNTLQMTPCIPRAWPGFTLTYRHRRTHESVFAVQVRNPQSVCSGVKVLQLDGQNLPPEAPVELPDDGAAHALTITLG